jgi:hypothetical protein
LLAELGVVLDILGLEMLTMEHQVAGSIYTRDRARARERDPRQEMGVGTQMSDETSARY